MKKGILNFVRAYLIFLLCSLAINVSMEILVPTPEREKIVVEHGWGYLMTYQVRGLAIFYMMFSLPGSVIFLRMRYGSLRMGELSLAVGFFLEFAAMRPKWVMDIMALRIGETCSGRCWSRPCTGSCLGGCPPT